VTQEFPFFRRLHKPKEFELVLKNKGLTDKWLALHFKENTIGIERIGIIVSKRIVARAVERNRIKRLIRESFRQNYATDVCALDVVVRLRKKLSNQDIADFKKTLILLLMKVRKTI